MCSVLYCPAAIKLITMENGNNFFDQFVPPKTTKKFCFKKALQGVMKPVHTETNGHKKQTVNESIPKQVLSNKITLSTKKLASNNYVKCNNSILPSEKEIFKDKTTVSSSSKFFKEKTIASNDKCPVEDKTSACDVRVFKNSVISVNESISSTNMCQQLPKNGSSTKKFTFKKSNVSVVHNLDSLCNRTSEVTSVAPQNVVCTSFNDKLGKNEVTAMKYTYTSNKINDSVVGSDKFRENVVRLKDKTFEIGKSEGIGVIDIESRENEVRLEKELCVKERNGGTGLFNGKFKESEGIPLEKTYSNSKSAAFGLTESSFEEASFSSISNEKQTLNDTIDLNDIDWNSEIMMEDSFKSESCLKNAANCSSVSAGSSQWNSSVFEDKKLTSETQTNPFNDRKDDSGKFIIKLIVSNDFLKRCVNNFFEFLSE